MNVKIGKITLGISLGFVAFLTLVSDNEKTGTLCVSLLFSLVHEGIHLISLYLYGCRELYLGLSPGGMYIKSRELSALNYKKTAIVSLSAPLGNLLLSVLFSILPSAFYKDFAEINFILGGVNLLPLSFLDGGRALCGVLYTVCSPERAEKILYFTDILSLLFLLIVCMYLSVKAKTPSSLTVFAGYCLLYWAGYQKSTSA